MLYLTRILWKNQEVYNETKFRKKSNASEQLVYDYFVGNSRNVFLEWKLILRPKKKMFAKRYDGNSKKKPKQMVILAGLIR